MSDLFNLVRFIEAQAPVYSRVCSELRQGRKVSHWMWFVFPQIEGLGRSGMARKFAISSLEEAGRTLIIPCSDRGYGNARGSSARFLKRQFRRSSALPMT